MDVARSGRPALGAAPALTPGRHARMAGSVWRGIDPALHRGDGTIYFGGGTHTPASVFALNPEGPQGLRGSLTGFFAIGP